MAWLPNVAAESATTKHDAQITMQKVIEDYVYEESLAYGDEVEIEFLTPLEQFPACPEAKPSLVQAKKTSGRIAIRVKCDPSTPTQYVKANLTILIDYVVAAHDLSKGHPVQASDLELKRGDSKRVRDRVFKSFDQVEGKVTSRSIRQGRAVQTNMVRDAWLVQKGESVKLKAEGDGFSITRDGQALDNGALGATIRVKTESGKIIQGKVTGNQEVSVHF